MWYTFRKGAYDFGATEAGRVALSHETDYLDLFFMVDATPVALLNDFYQLTGNPVLLPKFGFYQGTPQRLQPRLLGRGRERHPLRGRQALQGEPARQRRRKRESLNGEKNNYQFSARAVIDRYAAHDMPFGWLLPQRRLRSRLRPGGDARRQHPQPEGARRLRPRKGVEIGLWTQSDLHPKPEVSALLQRDIIKEVRDAGVRVLKTDVAWVGAGYSFGLNGIADVAQIMPYYGNDARPFIISLDGWAARSALRRRDVDGRPDGRASGSTSRFHIPTYIGSGLSGQPNITSDMDGIFGGRNLQGQHA